MGRNKQWNRSATGLTVTHDRFANEITGKYGPIRHGMKSGHPLIFRLSPNEERKPARKSAPTSVHVHITAPAPVQPEKKSKPHIQERIVERERIIEHERVVERRVVVVREVERIIYEQRRLRDQAVTQLTSASKDSNSAESQPAQLVMNSVPTPTIASVSSLNGGKVQQVLKRPKTPFITKAIVGKPGVTTSLSNVPVHSELLKQQAKTTAENTVAEGFPLAGVNQPTNQRKQLTAKPSHFAESISMRSAWPLSASSNIAFRKLREGTKAKKASTKWTSPSQKPTLYADVVMINRTRINDSGSVVRGKSMSSSFHLSTASVSPAIRMNVEQMLMRSIHDASMLQSNRNQEAAALQQAHRDSIADQIKLKQIQSDLQIAQLELQTQKHTQKQKQSELQSQIPTQTQLESQSALPSQQTQQALTQRADEAQRAAQETEVLSYTESIADRHLHVSVKGRYMVSPSTKSRSEFLRLFSPFLNQKDNLSKQQAAAALSPLRLILRQLAVQAGSQEITKSYRMEVKAGDSRPNLIHSNTQSISPAAQSASHQNVSAAIRSQSTVRQSNGSEATGMMSRAENDGSSGANNRVRFPVMIRRNATPTRPIIVLRSGIGLTNEANQSQYRPIESDILPKPRTSSAVGYIARAIVRRTQAAHSHTPVLIQRTNVLPSHGSSLGAQQQFNIPIQGAGEAATSLSGVPSEKVSDESSPVGAMPRAMRGVVSSLMGETAETLSGASIGAVRGTLRRVPAPTLGATAGTLRRVPAPTLGATAGTLRRTPAPTLGATAGTLRRTPAPTMEATPVTLRRSPASQTAATPRTLRRAPATPKGATPGTLRRAPSPPTEATLGTLRRSLASPLTVQPPRTFRRVLSPKGATSGDESRAKPASKVSEQTLIRRNNSTITQGAPVNEANHSSTERHRQTGRLNSTIPGSIENRGIPLIQATPRRIGMVSNQQVSMIKGTAPILTNRSKATIGIQPPIVTRAQFDDSNQAMTASSSSASFEHAYSASNEKSHKSPSKATSFTALGNQATTTLELRRTTKDTGSPAQEQETSRVVTVDAPSQINVEQLQKAISELPQLNPEQLADQVYKSLMKRMKFEQRLRGF